MKSLLLTILKMRRMDILNQPVILATTFENTKVLVRENE
jgi:hypothetical protein